MNYRAAQRKIRFETAAMWPFVMLGKLFGHLLPMKSKHNIFLFFPNGDIGGSPQVNIDLTNCIKDLKPFIIFSKKPGNNQFWDKYQIPGVRVWDLHSYIDNKLFHVVNFFYRGFLSVWINKVPDTVVFGGESLFFYKMLPHLKKHVHTVELCHLDTWLGYTIGFIDRIHVRVFSTEKLKEQVALQYQKDEVPDTYSKRLFFTDNGIEIPEYKHTENERLQVYFIGRGSPQKRVHLIVAIAKEIHTKSLPIDFHLIGDVQQQINQDDYPFCHFYGNIKDQEQMKRVYEKADVLLLTSAFEGLPIVVMQMMAYGKVVVSTAVNGIPDYIQHRKNGLLITSTEDSAIISEGCNYLIELMNDRTLCKNLGEESKKKAVALFSKKKFCETYRRLLKIGT